jgi:predicted GIY-YIG superfamily endonuclease
MVYLLHFDRPYKHARHYLGFAHDVELRLADHRAGHGARLMEVIADAGITFTLARTWEGDRPLERSLKNQKNSPRLCPICRELLKTNKERMLEDESQS